MIAYLHSLTGQFLISHRLDQWRADEAARQQQSFWYRTAKVTTGRSCAWLIVVAVLAAAVPVAYQVPMIRWVQSALQSSFSCSSKESIWGIELAVFKVFVNV